MAGSFEWATASDLVIDGVVLRADAQDRFTSTKDLFCVIKRPDLVEEYIKVVQELRPQHVVELGICKGGSTALLAMLAQPTRLMAFELSSKRAKGLDELIDARGLHESVRLFYEVDQADRSRLASLV